MLVALATGLGILAIVIGCYEVLTGRLPGGPRSWLWLRPNSPPLHIRLTAALGVLVGLTLLVLDTPDSLLAYGVGTAALALSLGIVVTDLRTPR